MLSGRQVGTSAALANGKVSQHGETGSGQNWVEGGEDQAHEIRVGMMAASAAASRTHSRAGLPDMGLLNSVPIQTWLQSQGDSFWHCWSPGYYRVQDWLATLLSFWILLTENKHRTDMNKLHLESSLIVLSDYHVVSFATKQRT